MIHASTWTSGAAIVLAGILTLLLSSFLLLVLSQMEVIAFTGGGWLVTSFNLIMGYLGYSLGFFVPVLLLYGIFFYRLQESLSRYPSDPAEMENVRFYNGAVEMFITLFFGIGVLFTAWGLQNALVSALGGMTKAEAAQVGAWGILKKLVENGILIALWSTIVGGAGGYLLRFLKYIVLGRALNRFSRYSQDTEKQRFFGTLEDIRDRVKRIEEKTCNVS